MCMWCCIYTSCVFLCMHEGRGRSEAGRSQKQWMMSWQSYWRNYRRSYWQSFWQRLMVIFCFVYVQCQKGSVWIIYICFYKVYIRGQKGSAQMIYVYFCLVYIRGWKESAQMIYICIVWYTFGVGRGVLE